jgi:hypothetical protein
MQTRPSKKDILYHKKLANRMYGRKPVTLTDTPSDAMEFKTSTQKMLALMLFTSCVISLASLPTATAAAAKQPKPKKVIGKGLSKKALTAPISYMKATSTLLTNCKQNPIGMNKGQICFFNGKNHYLKTMPATNVNPALNSVYNFRFIQNNLGLSGPTHFLITDNGHCHFTSEEVKNFKTIDQIWGTHNRVDIGKNLLKRIGYTEFAKLVVAATLIPDLSYKNWGLAGNKIVIVDADIRFNGLDLSQFFEKMSQVIWMNDDFFNGGFIFPLSVQSLQDMQALYQDMLHKPLPQLNQPSVDMSDEYYKKIITTYYQICTNVLGDLKKSVPQLSTDPKATSFDINKKFIEHMQRAAIVLRAENPATTPRPN